MIQARLANIKHTNGEEKINAYIENISITPLAIPMICSLGAITNAIVLMEDSQTIYQKIVLIGVIVIVLLLTYLILISGRKITCFSGKRGNKVIMRLMRLKINCIRNDK